MRARLTLALAAAAAICAIAAPSASACSCAPLELDRQTFRKYDAAIIGKLVSKGPVLPSGSRDYTFRVGEVFRGKRRIEGGSKLAVRSSASGASCGIEAPKGRRLGLFMTRGKGHWQSSLCLTTTPRQMRRAAGELGYAKTLGC